MRPTCSIHLTSLTRYLLDRERVHELYLLSQSFLEEHPKKQQPKEIKKRKTDNTWTNKQRNRQINKETNK